MQQGQVVKANIVMRCLATIERAGNALPNPVLLFLYLSIAVVLLSGIAAFFELSVNDPRPLGSPGRELSGSISVISLCTLAGLHRILTSLVSNFIQFAPLGTVLVALLGVGIAERSGLISALMRKIIIGAPAKLVTLCIVFAGVISNTAGELGYVVLIPLAAVIFHSLGRHPLAGLAAAFAGVSGGYSANLLLGAVDPVLSGITQQAAQLVAQNYQVGAEANWYFMLASTFLVTLSAYAVTEYIVEPSLGRYQIQEASAKQQQAITAELSDAALSDLENKALKRAAIVAVLFFIVLALTVLPEHGILLNPATGKLAGSPFLQSIVAFIFLFFTLTGMTYGYSVGSFKRQDDI
ncbi:MAG: AbgT family transporter, partial [Pseudomonadales bacterium]|nr:AbgT family transporter [Pseudomonadales bacterium]